LSRQITKRNKLTGKEKQKTRKDLINTHKSQISVPKLPFNVLCITHLTLNNPEQIQIKKKKALQTFFLTFPYASSHFSFEIRIIFSPFFLQNMGKQDTIIEKLKFIE
jgi:hypothetical protein